jgi:hypothetical protein
MALDPFGSADVQRQIAEELRRIGVDGALQSGLAAGVPVTPEQLLAAFRATPTGAGNQAFLVALQQILEKE